MTSRQMLGSTGCQSYLAGLIENWGRGVEKIYQACKKDGSPLPEYTVHLGDIMIQFSAAKGRAATASPNTATEEAPDRVTEKPDGVTERVTEVTEGVTEVTEIEQAILELLLENPSYTYATLSEKLGRSRKNISTKIKSLKEKGMIRRVGSDTKGFWDTSPTIIRAKKYQIHRPPKGLRIWYSMRKRLPIAVLLI